MFLFSSISAVAFKNAKQFEQAKDACLKEAVAHENNRAYLSPFGNGYEFAAFGVQCC